MAIPLVGAAAIAAARVVAKKLATRAVGGITGTGAKFVGTEYRNMNTGSVKVVKPISEEARAAKNAAETMKVSNAKSGGTTSLYNAISGAGKAIDKSMGKKTPVIKINSGNTRAK